MMESYVTQAELVVGDRDLANILCRFFGITDDGHFEVVRVATPVQGEHVFQLVRHEPREED